MNVASVAFNAGSIYEVEINAAPNGWASSGKVCCTDPTVATTLEELGAVLAGVEEPKGELALFVYFIMLIKRSEHDWKNAFKCSFHPIKSQFSSR